MSLCSSSLSFCYLIALSVDAQKSPHLFLHAGLASHPSSICLLRFRHDTIFLPRDIDGRRGITFQLRVRLTEHVSIYGDAGCGVGQTCVVTIIVFLSTWPSCCPVWSYLYAELTDPICSSWCSNAFGNVHLTQTTQLQRAGYASLPHLISHPNQPLYCFFPLIVFSLHSWHSQGTSTELFYWSFLEKCISFHLVLRVCVRSIHIGQYLSCHNVNAAPLSHSSGSLNRLFSLLMLFPFSSFVLIGQALWINRLL